MTSLNPSDNRIPRETHGAERRYLDLGLAPIPIRLCTNPPSRRDWPSLRLGLSHADSPVPSDSRHNFVVPIGAPSGGLVDVELDTPKAIAITRILAGERIRAPPFLAELLSVDGARETGRTARSKRDLNLQSFLNDYGPTHGGIYGFRSRG